jgi:hypothetical protein
MIINTATVPFEELRMTGSLYVDKTNFIQQLLTGANSEADKNNLIFLARPRRFGKSLFLLTMESVFRGQTDLFKGLHIGENGYDFLEYPTLMFDLSDVDSDSPAQLKYSLYEMMIDKARGFGLSVENDLKLFKLAFKSLVKHLYEKSGQPGATDKKGKKVVILVDEYDSPILDVLEDDAKAVQDNVKALAPFFETIKTLNQSGYIKFAFVTGVSKFTMTSIFSGANSFKDISESPDYANICGITYDEFDRFIEGPLKTEFAEGRFKGTKFSTFAEFKSALVEMYDGYSWNGVDKLFNPFSLLNALSDKELNQYWFGSGTPTFLVRYVKNNPVRAVYLENATMSKRSLMAQSVAKKFAFAPLLYQTGYLTLKKPAEGSLYSLKIPNTEVRDAWEEFAVESLLDDTVEGGFENLGEEIKIALLTKDEKLLEKSVSKLMGSIDLFPSELRERTFQFMIAVTLTATGVRAVKMEKVLEKKVRCDIFFDVEGESESERKGVLLEIKQVEYGPQQSLPTLEEVFTKKLEEAGAQLKQYYEPLFSKYEVDEIQGYAVAACWGQGVRVKAAEAVKKTDFVSSNSAQTISGAPPETVK